MNISINEFLKQIHLKILQYLRDCYFFILISPYNFTTFLFQIVSSPLFYFLLTHFPYFILFYFNYIPTIHQTLLFFIICINCYIRMRGSWCEWNFRGMRRQNVEITKGILHYSYYIWRENRLQLYYYITNHNSLIGLQLSQSQF